MNTSRMKEAWAEFSRTVDGFYSSATPMSKYAFNCYDEGCNLERELAAVTKERDEAREQRDKLAEALREVREMCLDKTIELHPDHDLKGTIDECIDISNDALQSLTTNEP